MNPDLQRWDDKYIDTSQIVSPEAEPELVEFQHLLPTTGSALELACGKGANALYLASKGFDVTAIDGSQNGLKILQQSAQHHGLQIKTICHDLEKPLGTNGRYDLVSVVRYLNRALFVSLPSYLNPGGILFVKTFNQRFLKHKPRFNPDYVLDDGELLSTYHRMEVLACTNEPIEATSTFILAKL